MAPTPTITVDTESGGSYPEATEQTLRGLVEQMNQKNIYLIVHRSDRPDDEYVQAALERDDSGSLVPGSLLIEYRDGPNSQWQAKVQDRRIVHEVLAGWAFDRAGWRDVVPWKKLELGF